MNKLQNTIHLFYIFIYKFIIFMRNIKSNSNFTQFIFIFYITVLNITMFQTRIFK